MLPKIRLCDTQFAHNPECSFGAGDLKIKPTFFEWNRSANKAENDIVVMTESCMKLVDMQPEKIRILLILEPPCINAYTYQWIKQPDNYAKFDYILTYNSELLNLDKKFVSFVFGGCWIKPEDRKIHEKTKDISIIASWKKNTEGQRLRHEVIERFGDKIDVYGNGYKFVENKLEALQDYRYSIVIENEQTEFLTEKLIDCFSVGTIPIYWGSQIVGKHFNMDGVFNFNDINALETILNYVDDKIYNESIDAIKSNFERAKEFCIPEDRIYQTFFKPVLGL